MDTLLELNQDMEDEPVLKRRKLGNTLKEAYESVLSEDQYLSYIPLLENGNPDRIFIADILEKTTGLYPKSSQLWCKRLSHAIQMKSEDAIESIFIEGKSHLTDFKDFYHIMIGHWKVNNQHSNIEKLFKEVCFKSDSLSAEFRDTYLMWTFQTQSLAKARKLYEQLNNFPPPTLSFYYTMIEIESQQETINVSRLRNCYELASHQFGKTSVRLWMDFIKFEEDQEDLTKAGLLYDRAKNMLNTEFADDFVSNYRQNSNRAF